MGCLWEAIRHMPLILCVVTPLSIFVTYGIAVAYDHVFPLWPYISDTGTNPPESCVFGLFLNAVAYLLCSIIYLRYREVQEYTKLRPGVRISRGWNVTAACLGFVSSLGLDLVANFQETNQFVVHIVGALMCFFSGTLYFFLQTIFTYKMDPKAKVMLWVRIVSTLLNVLFIVGTFAPIHKAMKEFKKENILQWKPSDGGFVFHAISTFSEWFLVFSFCAYICTLVWDFRKLKIEPPKIRFLNMEIVDGAEEEEEKQENEEANKQPKESLWI